MNIKKDVVVLAAMLHDIGKFMQRAEVPFRYERNENEMQLVCKYDPKKNYFSHKHTLWTVEFFESNELYFPHVSVKFDNADDNLANFAAKQSIIIPIRRFSGLLPKRTGCLPVWTDCPMKAKTASPAETNIKR